MGLGGFNSLDDDLPIIEYLQSLSESDRQKWYEERNPQKTPKEIEIEIQKIDEFWSGMEILHNKDYDKLFTELGIPKKYFNK